MSEPDRKRAGLGLRIACAAVLCAAFPSVQAVDAIEHELEIAHTDQLSPATSDVDRILGDAATTLQRRDSSNDVACPVALKRKGNLVPIPAKSHPGAVQTYDEMAKLRELPGDVKIVREITWCGEPGIFLGCGGPQKGLMAVVPMDDAASDGILWAHEIGHYKGIGHTDPPVEHRLMLPVIANDHREITDKECEKYAAAPLPVFGLKGKVDKKIFVQPSPAAAAKPAPLRPIREFVRQYWVHGVPYSEALRYDAEVVPTMLEMLKDPKERPFRSNIVQMIGLVGSREHVNELISFFRRGEGRLPPSEARAKSAVLLAVGFLQNRSPSQAAQAFLVQNSNPNQVSTAWLGANVGEAQLRQREIARTAAAGIAFSGQPALGTWLAEIQVSIEQGAFTLNTGAGEPHEYVRQLRDIHESVNKRGLGPYLRGER